MENKPNYSLKDLLNELKEKEKGCNATIDVTNDLIRVACGDFETYCPTCQAEISALKKGIKACEEILNNQELNSFSPNEQKKMQQAENRIQPRGLLEGDSVDKTAVPDTQIIEHYKKYGVAEGDKLLLETAKNNFKKGQESREKEILEKIDKNILTLKKVYNPKLVSSNTEFNLECRINELEELKQQLAVKDG